MTGIEPNVQPPQPDPVISPPPPPRRPMWRPLSALMCFAAAILTLLGSFVDLLTTEITGRGQRIGITVTAWGPRATEEGVPDWLIATNGPPLIFAAFLLLAAALLALFAAAAPGSMWIVRASTLSAVAGLAFLAGIAWAILTELLSWIDRFESIFDDGPLRYEIHTSIKLGFWFIVAATVAAIAGVVFAFLPIRRRRAARAEPETPPLGVPAVVVHRLPDAEPEDPDA